MASAADPASAQSRRERPTIHAVQATESPRIDGVLDEAVWQSATPIDTFIQQEPNEGQPASDRTEVRVLYDSKHIYIGVYAHAAEPVVATEMRRDADRLFDEDNFQVIIDTFHDSRNNIRFNFIYRPGSDLYVVYNELRQTGLPADIFGARDRQLVVKMTYLLQR